MSLNTKHCFVSFCRHSCNSHVTSAHLCGKCGKLGHGQLECGNDDMIKNLDIYKNQNMPITTHCLNPYCNSPETHSTIAHTRWHSVCEKCLENVLDSNGNPHECIIYTLEDIIDTYSIDMRLTPSSQDIVAYMRQFDNIYFIEPAGQGSAIYIRKKNGNISCCFLHGDLQGQYGINHMPIVNRFISGLQDISVERDTFVSLMYNNDDNLSDSSGSQDESGQELECPVCRTPNKKDSILTVYGSNDDCSICLGERKARKVFPICGHLCVCDDCFSKLKN